MEIAQNSDYIGRDFVTTEIPVKEEYDQVSVHSAVLSKSSKSSQSSNTSHRRHHRHHRKTSEFFDDDDGPWIEDNLLVMFGLTLILLTCLYFYWDTNQCSIPPREETNLTIQYAIDQINAYEESELEKSSKEQDTTT